MPTPELEKDAERHFVKRVKELGGRTWKFRSPTNRGVVDRIAVLPGGRVWFVEIKRPGGVFSELQKLHRDELVALGARHTAVFGKLGVDGWFEQEKAMNAKVNAFAAEMAARPKGAR